jgi:acetyl esterase/lipase
VPPENLVVAGDSAGGALGLALLLYLRDNGYTLPGGAILFSPWVGRYKWCIFTANSLRRKDRFNPKLRIMGY